MQQDEKQVLHEEQKEILSKLKRVLKTPEELIEHSEKIKKMQTEGEVLDISDIGEFAAEALMDFAYLTGYFKALIASELNKENPIAIELNNLLDENIKKLELDEILREKVQIIADGVQSETLEPLSVIAQSGYTYLATSKANGLQPLISKEGALGVNVGGKGDKNACISVSIRTPDNKPIAARERELQEAAGALMQRCDRAKPVILSVDQIYKEYAGLQPGATVRPEKIKETEQTLDRLRKCDAIIDFSQQAKKHEKLGLSVDSATIERAAIPADKVTAVINGRKTVGYRFYAYPPFYEYSAEVNQIAKVEQKLLNASAEAGSAGSRRNSDDFIVLKRVLLKRLERMKAEAARKNGKYERRRSYAKIYSEVLGTETPSAKKAEKMRGDIDKYLTALQEQGYIKGFSKYRNGRAYAGVEIDL